MAGTVGSFLIDIGFKGMNSFSAGLKKMDAGLKDLVTSSFYLKAGVAAAIYGLAKMSQVAGEYGRQLSMLQTRTDVSAEAFQKFAYAGELAGVKADDTIGTINRLQKAMDEFAVSGEGPQWFNQLFATVDGDINKAKDPIYMLGKLQEYALAKTDKFGNAINKQQKRLVLSSFGLSDDMIAAMMNGAFNAKAMREANVVTERQLRTLSKVNTEWSKLRWNAKTFQAQLIATFGEDTVGSISTMMNKLYQLVSAFMNFVDKSKIAQGIFYVIGKIFDGWTAIFDYVTEAINIIKEKGLEGYLQLWKEFFGAIGEIAKEAFGDIFRGLAESIGPALGPLGKIFDGAKNLFGFGKEGGTPATPGILNNPAAPVMSKSSIMNSAADNRKVTINQTNNFTNSDDNPQQLAQATTQAVNSDSFKSQTTAAMRGLIGTSGGY